MADVQIPSFGSTLTEVQKDDSIVIYDASGTVSGNMPVSTLLGGWRDLRASIIGAKAAGVNNPTLTSFGTSGGIYQYKFDLNDEVFLAFHIDHDIKVGSTIYPHVHWATSGTDVNTVKWEMEYMIAGRNDTTHEVFPAPTTIDVTGTPQGTAWEHIVTEHATGFTAPEVDSLVLLRIARVTNGGINNSNDVFALFCDLHYETQQYGTKSRAPDFYT